MKRVAFIILLFLFGYNLSKAQQDSSIVFNQSVKNWLDSLHSTSWVLHIIDSTHNDFQPICFTDSTRDSVVYINDTIYFIYNPQVNKGQNPYSSSGNLYMMPKQNMLNPDFAEILYFIKQQPEYKLFSIKMITIIYKKQTPF